MWQLQQMGYTEAPILVFDRETDYTKERIESLTLKPQVLNGDVDVFDESDSVTLTDLIPFSQGNRELIKEKFGSGSNATLFSEKVGSETAKLLRDNARLSKQNEILKTPQNRIKNLIKLGVDKDTAWITAYTGKRIAYVCQRRVLNFAINRERLTRF